MGEIRDFALDLFSKFAKIDPEREVKLWLEDEHNGVNVICFS